MNIRIAKKILKNKETLKYTKNQVKKAEIVDRQYKSNKDKEDNKSE